MSGRREGGERRQQSERRRRPRPVQLPLLPEDEPPFLRPERRARVRRQRRGLLGRAVLFLEAAGGVMVAGLALWTGYAKVMAHDRLRVERLEVRGSHFLSEREVRELVGTAVGENILALDIDDLKARLRSSPWVADAAVSRTLPDTLRVEIRERTPVALAEVERLYLMDGEGVLIDMYGPRTAGFDLPIVRGLGKADPETRRERAQRAGALLRDLGSLAAHVSEVFVERSDLRVVLGGAGEVLLLGAPPYRERLLTFLSLRSKLAERCPDAQYFDLRFHNRIYAKRGTEWLDDRETATPKVTGTAAEGRPEPAAARQSVPTVPRPAAPEALTPKGTPDAAAGINERNTASDGATRRVAPGDDGSWGGRAAAPP